VTSLYPGLLGQIGKGVVVKLDILLVPVEEGGDDSHQASVQLEQDLRQGGLSNSYINKSARA
jgi:hypothetical protein